MTNHLIMCVPDRVSTWPIIVLTNPRGYIRSDHPTNTSKVPPGIPTYHQTFMSVTITLPKDYPLVAFTAVATGVLTTVSIPPLAPSFPTIAF